MTKPDFLTLSYLQSGSPVQQQAYHALTESSIFHLLSKYHPVLVGTLPLDIFVEGSDLDIICTVSDFARFEIDLHNNFSKHPGFSINHKTLSGEQSIICSFSIEGFMVEIVGQATHITEQVAYKHMIVEHKILAKQGGSFKEEIIRLKKSGIKTEPAFAKLLGLEGDPYQALLTFTA